jgi:hypothetical protein
MIRRIMTTELELRKVCRKGAAMQFSFPRTDGSNPPPSSGESAASSGKLQGISSISEAQWHAQQKLGEIQIVAGQFPMSGIPICFAGRRLDK